MIKLTLETMRRAIERAKQVRPRVTWKGERRFEVTGSTGGRYNVAFSVEGGHKLGGCDCAAGQRGQMCFHIAAAASVNIAIQSMRAAHDEPPALPSFGFYRAGWLNSPAR